MRPRRLQKERTPFVQNGHKKMCKSDQIRGRSEDKGIFSWYNVKMARSRSVNKPRTKTRKKPSRKRRARRSYRGSEIDTTFVLRKAIQHFRVFQNISDIKEVTSSIEKFEQSEAPLELKEMFKSLSIKEKEIVLQTIYDTFVDSHEIAEWYKHQSYIDELFKALKKLGDVEKVRMAISSVSGFMNSDVSDEIKKGFKKTRQHFPRQIQLLQSVGDPVIEMLQNENTDHLTA